VVTINPPNNTGYTSIFKKNKKINEMIRINFALNEALHSSEILGIDRSAMKIVISLTLPPDMIWTISRENSPQRLRVSKLLNRRGAINE
jgi:hypothetical protein